MALMNDPIEEGRTIEVLLAEDNPGDVRLTRNALQNSRIRMNLSVVVDGEEAMAYLRRKGNYAGAARPALVLLDLNMPRKDGREVLVEMRMDPNLACIPVVVFTSSEAEDDIVKSYELHANSFVTKPTYVEQYTAAVKSIENFWLRVAKLPPHCSQLR
jgi:two-component system, chemotaxis family, response regulator Rcp1